MLTLHPVAVRKDKAPPLLLHRTLHSCPPSLYTSYRWSTLNFTVFSTQKLRFFITSNYLSHRLWHPASVLSALWDSTSHLLCTTLALVSLSPACHCHRSHLRIPLYCCRWRTPLVLGWAKAAEWLLKVCTWVRLGENNGDCDLPGLNSGGFYLINSYHHCTLFSQVRHTG